MSTMKDAQQRALRAATNQDRERDAAIAMQGYEAEKLALVAKTTWLRALRLAKEAAEVVKAKKQRKSERHR